MRFVLLISLINLEMIQNIVSKNLKKNQPPQLVIVKQVANNEEKTKNGIQNDTTF